MSEQTAANDDHELISLGDLLHSMANSSQSREAAGIHALLVRAWFLENGWTSPPFRETA